MTIRSWFKSKNIKLRRLNMHLRYLIPLLILFSLDVSRPEAQGANFWSRQEQIPEYYNVTEEPPYLIADMDHLVHVFHAQPLHLNDKALQTSNTIWSEPVLLFQVDGAGEIQDPFVISDPYGNVHVFWSVVNRNQGESDLIYYTRLDANGWITPVDVIAAYPARAVNVAISQDDFIYLIWNGSESIISYSRAPIKGAEFVKNWSEPITLTKANTYASIVTSPSGIIYLAYPGVGTSGIFEQFLEPNNLVWSSPRTISQTSLTDTGSDFVQIRVSNNGTLHVVWTEFYYPDGWPPRGVFYARSVDGGEYWSAPVLLAGDGLDQINIYVLDDNNIHVAWNGMAGVGGRYYRWSSDGGETWSETIETMRPGSGGTEGPPEIVGDQSGTLHMLMAYESCTYYTYLENQRWVTPVCISGEKARASNYIEEPAMAVSEGNKLHAVFWDDRKRLWYTTKVTEAPYIPPRIMDNELIQPAQSPIPENSSIVTPAINSTSLPVDQRLDPSSRFNINPWQILIIGLSPVILLVILIAALGFYKKTR